MEDGHRLGDASGRRTARIVEDRGQSVGGIGDAFGRCPQAPVIGARTLEQHILHLPADAIVTFRKSGIDALFMDDVCLTA